MNRAAASSMSGVEVVLFVVEANRWTTDDEMVLNKLKKSQRPVILVVNKIDQIKDKSSLLPQLQQLAARHTFAEIVPLSAATGDQVEALRSLVHQYAKRCASLS